MVKPKLKNNLTLTVILLERYKVGGSDFSFIWKLLSLSIILRVNMKKPALLVLSSLYYLPSLPFLPIPSVYYITHAAA